MSPVSGGGLSSPLLCFIDTHCHLDEPDFDADRAEVLAFSVRAGVAAWVNVGYRPDRWMSTVELARRTRGMAHMLGLHPHHASAWTPQLHEQLAALLQSSNAVAVGEIGLDYARGRQQRTEQRRAFAAQLDLAVRWGRGVVIHQRQAAADVVDLLKGLPTEHPVLLHSFDGDERLLSLAAARGYLLGVGGLATRAASHTWRHHLRDIPLAQVVLETDSPYLLPAGMHGQRNTPAHIPAIAAFLAGVKGVPIETVATATTANAHRFFGEWEMEAMDTSL